MLQEGQDMQCCEHDAATTTVTHTCEPFSSAPSPSTSPGGGTIMITVEARPAATRSKSAGRVGEPCRHMMTWHVCMCEHKLVHLPQAAQIGVCVCVYVRVRACVHLCV